MPVATESAADFKDMPETAAPISVEQMDITMPIPGWTVTQMTNLLRMLCSKQNLINRMLDYDMLSIEESFVQAMSENPPESTDDLEARVQKAIEVGSADSGFLTNRLPLVCHSHRKSRPAGLPTPICSKAC